MGNNPIAPKTAQAIIICKAPDVCKTPMGSSMVPVPYMITSTLDLSEAVSTSVFVNGQPVLNAKSFTSRVMGDEPGVGKGLKQSSHMGMCVPYQKMSPSVFIHGEKMVTHNTIFWMNCPSKNSQGNTLGTLIYANMAPLGRFSGDVPTGGNPPTEPETEAEEGWFARARQYAEEQIEELKQTGAEVLKDVAEFDAKYKVSTRAMGAAQAAGGIGEMILGAAGVVAPEPVTSVGGALLVVHGADNTQAGARTLWTGEFVDTAVEAGAGSVAEALGASPEMAENVKAVAGMVGPPSSMAKGVGKNAAQEAVERGAREAAEEASEKAAREAAEATSEKAGKEASERGGTRAKSDEGSGGHSTSKKGANRRKGSCGEHLARQHLQEKGVEMLKSESGELLSDVLSNGSGHGLDVIGMKDGKIFVGEVKTNSATLSKHQKKGGTKYLKKQLKDMRRGLKKGEGRFKSLKDKPGAKEALDKLEKAMKKDNVEFEKIKVPVEDDPDGDYTGARCKKGKGDIKASKW